MITQICGNTKTVVLKKTTRKILNCVNIFFLHIYRKSDKKGREKVQVHRCASARLFGRSSVGLSSRGSVLSSRGSVELFGRNSGLFGRNSVGPSRNRVQR